MTAHPATLNFLALVQAIAGIPVQKAELNLGDVGLFSNKKQKMWLASHTDDEWASIVNRSAESVLDAVHKLTEEFKGLVQSGQCLGKSTLQFRAYRDISGWIEDCWVFRESLAVEDWLRQLHVIHQTPLSDGSLRGLSSSRLVSTHCSVGLPKWDVKAICFEFCSDTYGPVTDLQTVMKSCPVVADAEIVAQLAEPHAQFSDMIDQFTEDGWEMRRG